MKVRSASVLVGAMLCAAGCGDPGLAGDIDASTSRDRDIGRTVVDTGVADAPVRQAPTAVAGDDFADVAGRPIRFDGSASSDPDGQIVSWRWEFGDGSIGSGETLSHTFVGEGVYEVTLTVTDDDGLSGQDSLLLDLVDANSAPDARITGPDEVVVGEIERWRGDGSTDDVRIDSYAWNTGVVGDEAIEGVLLEYAWTEFGVYQLALTVTDSDGLDDIATLDVRALAPPVAEIDAPVQADERAEVRFDGTGSYDPDDGTITTFAWDFDDGTTATGPLPRHTFALPGDYDVVLTVTDDDELMGAAVHKVSVLALDNVAPVAVADADRFSALTGETVTLSGVDSYDTDGSVVRYAWDFGDGDALAGDEVSHAWRNDGAWTATLTVTDDEGLTGTDTIEVVVGNRVPVARFTSPAQVVRGRLATFDASSSTDADGNIVWWRWSFDGTIETVETPTTSRTFTTHGLVPVSLIVVDDDGAESAPFPLTVEVLAPPTAVIIAPTTGVAGTSVELDGAASSDVDGTIVRWDWDFGDGGSSAAMSPTRAFGEGTWDVALTVTDDDGLSATTSHEIVVGATPNLPPTALIDVATTRVDTLASTAFLGGGSTDPDGFVATWRWDFGDGGSATGPDASHAWDDDGVYTVTLTVTDDDGASDIDTVDVTVRNRAPIAAINGPVTVEAGATAVFSGASSVDQDGTVVSWQWDLGDGTTVTDSTASVSHVWASPGSYVVTLVVVDNDGAVSTPFTRPLSVQSTPTARIDAPASAFVDQVVTLDGTGSSDNDGAISAYRWTFGDGATGTGATVTHAWSATGNRDVTLTVTDADGLTASATHRISISIPANVPPVAVAAADPSTAPTGTVISFSSEGSRDSDGTVVGWAWDFGDGSSSTFPSPTHAWTDDGEFEVTLTVTDDDGASASTSLTVTITNRAPVAVLLGPSSVLVGVDAVVTAGPSADADGTIVEYRWDDGTSSFVGDVNETFSWSTTGTRTVTLTVVDNDGATGTASLVIDVRAAPSADLDAPSTGTVGIPAAFDGSPSSDIDGSIVSWSWSFGDGSTAFGTSATHVYDTAGTYTVSLTVTDDDGLSDTITHTIVIAAPVNQPPVAVATADASTVLTDVVVRFSGSGSSDPDGTIVSWAWDFGDGSSGSGAAPTHRYAEDGVYDAVLTVTDDRGGMDSDTVSVTVNNRPPVAVLSGPTTVVTNTSATFSAAGSSDPDGTVVGWRWNDGVSVPFDGASSASLRWSTHGTRTVTVTVTDNDGATAVGTTSVTVLAPPIARISAPTTVAAGASVTLNGASSSDADGVVTSWAWSSGDGRDLAGSSTSLIYDTPGAYVVRLVVTDDDGLTGEATWTINVSDTTNLPPTSRPGADTVEADTGDVVRFNSSDSSDPDGTIVGWLWDFGDGTSSPAPNPTHTFADNGVYVVQLTVTDDRGASHTAVIQVQINNRPPIAEIAPITPGRVGAVTTLDGRPSSDPDGTVVSWNWNFGDGVTSFGSQIGHSYDTSGTYVVTLTVTDDDGATGVDTQTITIVDEIDFVGVWSHPPISYSCVDNFFGFPAIDFSFSSLTMTGTRPSIAVSGAPVVMNGNVSGNVLGTVAGQISGGCTERYVISGSFIDESTASLHFELQLTGSQCGLTTCTNQAWDFTATR